MQNGSVCLEREQVVAALPTMTSAIVSCVPMASMVTNAPVSSSGWSSSGIATISFDLSTTASWPSTRLWRVAQAETRWSGSRPLARAWLRREVLPSMAMTSFFSSRSVSTCSARLEQLRVDRGDDFVERVVRGDAALERQKTAQKVQPELPPGPDLDEIVHPRDRAAQDQKQDLPERIGHLPDWRGSFSAEKWSSSERRTTAWTWLAPNRRSPLKITSRQEVHAH